MAERQRERDLILAPNEYAYLLDETKGNVINYVGPNKTSLANTDQPVIFNATTKKFERTHLDQAIGTFSIAPEGWYIVLKNPATDGKPPRTGAANNLPDLDIGRKVNIPGPTSFALWPGQMVRVLQGHHLRSNQYLAVRVYDEEGAKANWATAVVKPQKTSSETELPDGAELIDAEADEVVPELDSSELTMGKLLVIKGTSVSFYIPPTGIEVVRDPQGHYVRAAVTLERLEYCILLDEDGNKRYIKGPAVVFPKPTEKFVEKKGVRKFRAIELNEISGLYVKVIAPYSEGKNQYKVGDELFITGRDQMIYFPRPEHAIIRYGEREVHYAIAIPAGEARYVLDRTNGQITLKKGPCMFLPDPRKEVIVRRVLNPKYVRLWFPGNQEAEEYNRRLMELTARGKDVVQDRDVRMLAEEKERKPKKKAAKEAFAGDEFSRRQTFTKPRMVTLDTKYEGAVAINSWTGYSILVVSKTGARQVIVGPSSYLLEYDEILEAMELSTGTPKTDDKTIKTVYLRVLHNKVSDIVEAETKDICEVRVRLSYRVNFEGDPEKWFNVENYVKFLTDHMRSLLRHAIRQYGIEEFYADGIAIIRDTILGAQIEGKRTGRLFEENGMRIYDVEVLDINIGDQVIADLLVEAQHNTVEQTLEIASERRNLVVTEQKEEIKQKIAKAEATTYQLMLDLQMEEVAKRLGLNKAQVDSENTIQTLKLEAKLDEQDKLTKIDTAELQRKKASSDLELDLEARKLEQWLEETKGQVAAVVDKANAVSPQLISAMQAFSDRALAEKMAASMSPLAILGGKSVAEVFSQLVKGTMLESVLEKKE